jgi:hypothetical protein
VVTQVLCVFTADDPSLLYLFFSGHGSQPFCLNIASIASWMGAKSSVVHWRDGTRLSWTSRRLRWSEGSPDVSAMY